MLGSTGMDVYPDHLWELVLYGLPPVIDLFPDHLFFDNDLIWHQQQLGEKGLIATANLIVKGDKLYGNNYISDLVQRISRTRVYKSKAEYYFKGWPYLVINSILNFALIKGIKTFYSPSADYSLHHTDPNRSVKRPLFDRVYDHVIQKHYKAKREKDWWKIDIAENRDKIVIGKKEKRAIAKGKVICICHDIERGLGHVNIDNRLAAFANKKGSSMLTRMLAIEKEMAVKASYNVVGVLFNELRDQIEKEGHCLAFHSYDHRVIKGRLLKKFYANTSGKIRHLLDQINARFAGNQLAKCRDVDYRIKGYRAPQSVLTAELSDNNLCFHNFEWLGYYFPKTNRPEPVLENRVVKIPIQFDDYHMYSKGINFKDWQHTVIQKIKENNFLAIGLHDCYGNYWLPKYRDFLETIRPMAQLKTLNEVANEVFLTNGS